MTLGERVRRLRTERKLTQAALAAAVRKRGGELSQSQLSAIERDEADRPRSLVELAEELGTTEAILLGKADSSRLPEQAPQPTEAIQAHDAPPLPMRTEMAKDVPVYGTVLGGQLQTGCDFELNGTVVDYVRRPPRIGGRADVFAAYVQGDSMIHWRKPGQLVYLESVKPPRAGDYVLVELKPRDGESTRPALVKELLAITATKLRLRQYNPPRDFDVDRRSVLRVYRVMDWDELLGV